MRFDVFSCLAALSVTVLGEIHTPATLEALKGVRDATATFNKEISSWNGGFLKAWSLLRRSQDLVDVINSAASAETDTQSTTAIRSTAIDTEVLEVTRDIATEVGNAVDFAIEIKPKLESIPGVGKSGGTKILKTIHTAAKRLIDVYGPKACEEHKEMARTVEKAIDEHLVRGISAFA